MLKMDCKGCEYNLLEESKEIIRQFNRIVIEYHNGYKSLKIKLEEFGFNVSFTEPYIGYDETNIKILFKGYIYAKRI